MTIIVFALEDLTPKDLQKITGEDIPQTVIGEVPGPQTDIREVPGHQTVIGEVPGHQIVITGISGLQTVIREVPGPQTDTRGISGLQTDIQDLHPRDQDLHPRDQDLHPRDQDLQGPEWTMSRLLLRSVGEEGEEAISSNVTTVLYLVLLEDSTQKWACLPLR